MTKPGLIELMRALIAQPARIWERHCACRRLDDGA